LEVVDPRTLVPLDKGTILNSVKKTGRLVIAETANKTCGAGAEISAIVCEDAFGALKGPIARVAADDVPVPFSKALEPQIYPSVEKIIAAAKKTLK
jgi:pyruvate dehydrogenase E1 component beta subunit